jgi:hypothetical protein
MIFLGTVRSDFQGKRRTWKQKLIPCPTSEPRPKPLRIVQYLWSASAKTHTAKRELH